MRYSPRGGARIGAGRPKTGKAGVSHGRRPSLAKQHPVHVTLRVLPHVWQLRSRRCFSVISTALANSCDRFGMRVIAVSVQGNHVHLVVEATSAKALSRSMQGLGIRIAKRLNALMNRRGKVFAERYHAHTLLTPREVRAAVAYVHGNTRRHAAQLGRKLPETYRDPYAVGFFGGAVALGSGARMVVEPRTWLLRVGWRARCGRVHAMQP